MLDLFLDANFPWRSRKELFYGDYETNRLELFDAIYLMFQFVQRFIFNGIGIIIFLRRDLDIFFQFLIKCFECDSLDIQIQVLVDIYGFSFVDGKFNASQALTFLRKFESRMIPCLWKYNKKT